MEKRTNNQINDKRRKRAELIDPEIQTVAELEEKKKHKNGRTTKELRE